LFLKCLLFCLIFEWKCIVYYDSSHDQFISKWITFFFLCNLFYFVFLLLKWKIISLNMILSLP
jgi:hypothetical protein